MKVNLEKHKETHHKHFKKIYSSYDGDIDLLVIVAQWENEQWSSSVSPANHDNYHIRKDTLEGIIAQLIEDHNIEIVIPNSNN